MRNRTRWIFVAIVAFCLFYAAIPHLVAPDWTVTVVDEKGRPVSNEFVRESYNDYSCHPVGGNESTAVTDAAGLVHFPARYEHRFLFSCLFVSGCEHLNVHGSSGTNAFVFAFGQGLEGSGDQWSSSPAKMFSRIVIKARILP